MSDENFGWKRGEETSRGRNVVPPMNCATVSVVSICSLKVKTTAAAGETPMAPLDGRWKQ